MTKKYLTFENEYYSSDDSDLDNQDEIDNKNYVKLENNLIDMLKDIYHNVLLPEIEITPSILHGLDKYTEYSFINFFRENSTYYKSIETKQIN